MTLNELVDEYISKRLERLEAARTVSILEEKEQAAKQAVITQMQEEKSTVFGASLGTVTLQTKVKPAAVDWVKVWQYIYDNDASDLMQRRLTEAAVKLRWEDGIEIPGVDRFTVYDLSVGKAR